MMTSHEFRTALYGIFLGYFMLVVLEYVPVEAKRKGRRQTKMRIKEQKRRQRVIVLSRVLCVVVLIYCTFAIFADCVLQYKIMFG